MAYTLTKADMDAIDNRSSSASSSGGYVPTKADLDEWDAKLNNQSLVPSAPSFPLTAGQKIVNTVKDLASKQANAEIQGIKDLAGGATKGLIASGVNPNLTALFNNNNPVSNFGNPQSLAYGAGKLAGVTAPAILAGEGGMAALPEDAGRLLQGSVAGAAAGAATPSFNPQNELAGRLQNAAMGGIGGAVLGSLPAALSAIRSKLGDTADKISYNTASSLLRDPNSPNGALISPDRANQTVSTNLVGQYNNDRNTAKNLYNSFKNNATKYGYTDNATPPTSSSLRDPYTGAIDTSQKTAKAIGTSQSTDDALNVLLSKNDDMSPTSRDVVNLIKKFQGDDSNNLPSNKSLPNAVDLQSALFDAQKGLSTKGTDGNLKRFMNVTREGLLNDIKNTLNSDPDLANPPSGEQSLADQFDTARNYWKTNVVPYTQTTLMRSLLNGTPVKNVVDRLGSLQANQPNVNQSYEFLRNKLSQNPQNINNLAAAILSKGTTLSGNTVQAPAKNVLAAYAKTPSSIREIVKPLIGDSIDKIQALQDAKNNFLPRTIASIKQNPLNALYKAGIGIGGLGVGTAGLDYGIHKIIE